MVVPSEVIIEEGTDVSDNDSYVVWNKEFESRANFWKGKHFFLGGVNKIFKGILKISIF
jgi:hypothetical protein